MESNIIKLKKYVQDLPEEMIDPGQVVYDLSEMILSLPDASPAPVSSLQAVDNGVVMHDTLGGDMVELETLEDCRKWVRDNYTEGNEMHPDFASFDVYKKVGEVYVEENELGEAQGIRCKSAQPPAQVDAVEFAEWIRDERYVWSWDGKKWIAAWNNHSEHNTAELLQHFLQSKQKQ